MDIELTQILEDTGQQGVSRQVPWNILRPKFNGTSDRERIRTMILWFIERGRSASIPDLARPDGSLGDEVLVTICRV